MKSLIATACLLLQNDAAGEETSLMQSLVARHVQRSPVSDSRKDTAAKLMETATKMMKNGATPDVITFIETTITEVNRDILGVIVDEHNEDQQLIYDLLDRFDAAIAAMEACAASVRQQHTDREAASYAHQLCRSDEAIHCARSRKCEEELEELWRIVTVEEQEMREIHWAIHGQWCVGPDPPQANLDDPFNWHLTQHKEGAETSESTIDYPLIDNSHVIEFRRFSVDYFGRYIVQKPIVELAWENYNRKLLECAALEETWTLKVEDCDDLQTTMHDQACMHASTNRQCASNFGHEYHMTLVTYNDAVTSIRQKEYDRKREWETLHIVTCLLETVYTHVIHSIDSGEPCPTTESHPEQTAAEINTCHIIEESMTANLTIDYGTPPDPPELPPVVEPPCTQQYIWEESHFAAEIQTSHAGTIEAEGLADFFTVLSAYGWAGCAAPKACIPCEATDLIVDPAYEANTVCKAHHGHLHAGQMDWDTFKCLTGDECVEAAGRCNGVNNCGDGSDEVGCVSAWGVPAVLGSQECNEPFVSDLQFQCGDNTCTHIAGRCNGVANCANGADEEGCPSTTEGLTLEAFTGYTATITQPAIGEQVFFDRTYTFDSLGSFAGHSYIKMSNEDKHIRHSHVQMKLRLPQPMSIYVVKLDDTELPWLEAEGWTLTELDGVSYHGIRETRHTDWSEEVLDTHYGPGQVWQKIFPAGAVEMRGNNGGDGSYLMFAATLENMPLPPHMEMVEMYTQLPGFQCAPSADADESFPRWYKTHTPFDECEATNELFPASIAMGWNSNGYNGLGVCNIYFPNREVCDDTSSDFANMRGQIGAWYGFCNTGHVYAGEIFGRDQECCGAEVAQCWVKQLTAPPPVTEEFPAWTLVMQYGTEPYLANRLAIGTPSETETGAAKLSDFDINYLPRGATSGGMLLQTEEPHMMTYYKLTSETLGQEGQSETLLIRTLYAYDDADSRFGFLPGGSQFCKSSEPDQRWTGNTIESPAACTRWAGFGALDTHDVTGYGCSRWYSGHNGEFCSGPRSMDSHCWGGGCGRRVNLKMYKCTGEGC